MKNLKIKLLNNNITSSTELIKYQKLHDEVLGFIESTNLKIFNLDLFFKLLKEDELYCFCGKSIKTYDVNKKSFRTHCKYCCSIKKDLSNKIKKSRLMESEYTGDFYTIDETSNLLKTIDLEKYLGSGKQRTFIKEFPKLYFSILDNTKHLDCVKGINIRGRITFLLNPDIDIYCSCRTASKFCNHSHKFLKYCKLCAPKYPTKEYFIEKFGNNYEIEMIKDRNMRKIKYRGQMSLEWFIGRYGDIEGQAQHSIHYQKVLDSHKTTQSYSKVSQSLFWTIYDKLDGKDGCFFAELNREKHINLNKDDKLIYGDNKKVRLNLDFVYKNKIIEFNGNYWHSSQETRNTDVKRKQICENKGYDVLIVWENEYKKSPDIVIQKCINFLNSQDVVFNDRYLIETINGYEDFDNIISRGYNKTLLITTEKNEIVVTYNHKFVVTGYEIIASNLKEGDYLETTQGLEYITKIVDNGIEEVFDVLNTESHTFLANNINNHNCDFLGSSHTLVAASALEKFISKEPLEIRDNKLKIYKYPEKGHQYICSVDTAKDGIDDFSVQILDITDFKFEQVASAQLQIDYLLMPEYLNDWCEYYNKPYLIIENVEGSGQSVADQMYLTYEYENLHFDKDSGTKKKKRYPGFRTTGKSRKLILQTLKLFIENNNLNIHDKKTINQFYTFILRNNKYQADENCKDDAIMSLAIAFAPFCNSKNFEDMKGLVDRLYNDFDETSEDNPDHKNFTEYLTIGSFDDGVEEDFTQKSEYTWNGYQFEQEGFV